jgi:hypothetical protein
MKNYAHMHTQIRHCQAQMAVRRRAAPCPADDDQFGTTKTTGDPDIQFGRKAAVVAGDHVDDDFEAAPQALNVGK